MNQEKISAFIDGESDDSDSELLLSLLRFDHGRESWDVYHQIGDALRSEELAFNMSPDFSARLAARLEQEPTILSAPVSAVPTLGLTRAERRAANDASGSGFFGWLFAQKLALAGIGSAVLAAVLLVVAPPLMVASKDVSPTDVNFAPNSVVRVAGSSAKDGNTSIAALSSGMPGQSLRNVIPDGHGVMLRDPRIDDYLAAHQRFSPSVYSTAQYVRSAGFVSDPGQ